MPSIDPKEPLPQIAILEVLPLTPEVAAVSGPGPRSVSGAPAVELKDRVTIEVKDLKPWKEQTPGNSSAPLHLYLAGTELKNLTMTSAGERQDDKTGEWISTLAVILELDDKDATNRKEWIQVLQSAMRNPDTPISVGPANGQPFPSQARIALRVFPSYTWLVVFFLGAVALLTVVLAKRSNLLRDSNGATTLPYSLAKHQMAVWFLVVVGGYLYAWLITGTGTISTTALILVGISGTTGLAAIAIDNNKRQEQDRARMLAHAERDALDRLVNGPSGLGAQVKTAAPGSPEALELATVLHQKATRLGELTLLLAEPTSTATPGRLWHLDLLSDENGISFHRLQMVIWTLVLVGVFVRAVYSDVVMPDFDATLLGLMGLSSGTYLGFKLPEKK